MWETVVAYWTGLCSRLGVGQGGRSANSGSSREEVSRRIRERYDTARKQAARPTREWLRQHGVLDDWNDAWRSFDR